MGSNDRVECTPRDRKVDATAAEIGSIVSRIVCLVVLGAYGAVGYFFLLFALMDI